MMKQPAENTNATSDEAQEAAARVAPLPAAPDEDEIAKVARELWQARQGGGGSPEEDWFRASEIVRQRRAATTVLPDTGNVRPARESNRASTGIVPGAQSAWISRPNHNWKEQADMDNTITGTGETGTYTGAGAGNTMRDRMNEGRERMNEMMENEPRSMPRPEHREGRIARSLEQQTARIPSDAWLWAAVGSMGLSLALELSGKEKTANFVGHWAPTFLIFGLYNKMVKLQGSDGM
jgi:hypothetical protein